MGPHQFEFASGEVIGRDHRVLGKNYQDASIIVQTPELTVAVVTDGCGSGAHSEVGARLGVRLIAAAIKRQYEAGGDWDEWRTTQEVLASLQMLVTQTGDNLTDVVSDLMLFTVVGVAIDPVHARFFALGDGLIVINDEFMPLGPFPNNQPPYLSYGLYWRDTPGLSVVKTVPLAELDSFLLGTDGVCDLANISDQPIPGSTNPVGLLSQFWQDDRYFRNPVLVSRQLKLIGRDAARLDSSGRHISEAGLLPDDTTLIVGRRNLIGGEMGAERTD